MTYNLAQLVATKTSDTILGDFILTLQGKDFPATAWQSGGLQRTLIELMAIALARQSELLAEITKGGYLDEAEREWLTALASEIYQITRTPAQSAVYTVTLTESAGSPQTVSPNALWVGTPDGRRYQSINADPVIVPASGQATLQVRAESPGSRYNTGAGTIIIMHTPIPGVTVSNALANPDVSGADAEGDPSVRQRCKDKWSALGAGGNDAAYRYWAMAASTSVKKVKIVSNPGDVAGTVGIYLAGETSGVSGAVVTAVHDYILARMPTCVTPITASATTQTVDITGSVIVFPGYESTYLAAVNAALDTLFKSAPIGGRIDQSDIVFAIQSAQGIDAVTLVAPAGATTPASTAMLIKGTVTLPIA